MPLQYSMIFLQIFLLSKFHTAIFFLQIFSFKRVILQFQVATIIFGVFAMWASGHFGLRASILVAAIFNGLGPFFVVVKFCFL